ncbi:hypothetical protein B296_00027040 [Ensete ventricosum]|uniref:Uncharacterized protein n=1 Tax=Ensete ventricosum TaxID=4639 RepID=A0A426XXS0_ENSVE|nr:hypothetical protein B296_00027040 [Ensete ventricosum]
MYKLHSTSRKMVHSSYKINSERRRVLADLQDHVGSSGNSGHFGNHLGKRMQHLRNVVSSEGRTDSRIVERDSRNRQEQRPTQNRNYRPAESAMPIKHLGINTLTVAHDGAGQGDTFSRIASLQNLWHLLNLDFKSIPTRIT